MPKVASHRGSAEDFLRRHRLNVARLMRNCNQAGLHSELLALIADTRSLRLAADHVAREGGPGPGTDGIRADALDHSEWMELIRTLEGPIASGRYMPRPEKRIPRPKSNGGVRWLSIPTVADRVVQRSILQIITPLIDPLLSATTFGARPGYSTWDALIAAERYVGDGGSAIVVADIATAFDVVPHTKLHQVLEGHLGCTPLVDLMMRIVKNYRNLGIGQGGSLSPLMMNLYLHETLDLPWKRSHPDRPLIRWLDDLLVVCPDRATANSARTDLCATLSAAVMPPKMDPAPTVSDLHAGDCAPWLGYRISGGPNGLEARIDETAWTDLRLDLRDAHREDHSAQRAQQIVRGWLDYMGPCYREEDASVIPDRIVPLLREYSLEEAETADGFHQMWHEAHLRYRERRQAV